MLPDMAEITLRGNPIHTNGDLPAEGSPVPDFTLTKSDWTPVGAADLAGQRVVLNIRNQADTELLSAMDRRFNRAMWLAVSGVLFFSGTVALLAEGAIFGGVPCVSLVMWVSSIGPALIALGGILRNRG